MSEELIKYIQDIDDEKLQNEDNSYSSGDAKYSREIKDTPILSIEEELLLVQQMKKGSIEAKNKLILSNLRLVVKIAKDYAYNHKNMQDLIQEGNLKLVENAENYDPNLGIRFTTYVGLWIKKGMRDYIIKQQYAVRRPYNVSYFIQKYNKLQDLYYKETGRLLTDEEATKILGVSVTKILNAKKTDFEVISIDNEEEQIDDILYNEEDLTENIVVEKDTYDILQRSLNKLSKEELEILKLHYGLNDTDKLTLREIGKQFNCSRERIRRKELKALKKIRKNKELQGLIKGGV